MKTKSATEQHQREYYNRIANAYDRHSFSPPTWCYRADLYDHMLTGLKVSGKRVLDTMCGGGRAGQRRGHLGYAVWHLCGAASRLAGAPRLDA